MDMLFFFAACLGLAETVDLFMGKDFLIFMGKQMDEKDYDTEKVFKVERWLFAADAALSCRKALWWDFGGRWQSLPSFLPPCFSMPGC